jgi:hypothetical protein
MDRAIVWANDALFDLHVSTNLTRYRGLASSPLISAPPPTAARDRHPLAERAAAATHIQNHPANRHSLTLLG